MASQPTEGCKHCGVSDGLPHAPYCEFYTPPTEPKRINTFVAETALKLYVGMVGAIEPRRSEDATAAARAVEQAEAIFDALKKRGHLG